MSGTPCGGKACASAAVDVQSELGASDVYAHGVRRVGTVSGRAERHRAPRRCAYHTGHSTRAIVLV